MVALQQEARFGIKAQRGALVHQRLDALEQLVIEVDGVVVGGQLGRHFAVDRVKLVVGVGALQGREDGGGAGQQLARFFHRDNGVVEGRRVLVVGNRGNFRQVLAHAGHVGWLEVLVLDLVEGRVLEGQRARRGQRVGRRQGRCGISGLDERQGGGKDKHVGTVHGIFHDR